MNRAEDPRPRITGNLRDGSSCDPQFDDVPAGTGRFPGRLGLAAGGPAVAGEGHRAITLTLPGLGDGDDPQGLRLQDAADTVIQLDHTDVRVSDRRGRTECG